MVFTNAQLTTFFTTAAQLALSNEARAALEIEGIVAPDDLAEFRKTHWAQVVTNLKYPAGIPDPNNPGAFLRAQTVALGARSLGRLRLASKAARYYESIGRDLTPANMHVTNTLKYFDMQWASLRERQSVSPDVPKITRSLPVMQWSESIQDFWGTVIGIRNAPLTYVIRTLAAVPAAAPALVANRPFSLDHGSVEGELIARLSHDHPTFQDDNASCYMHLEEATRGTVLATTAWMKMGKSLVPTMTTPS